jgi:regulator of protease activity HflC (stomatin/prohibitin superfamily)
MQSLIDFIVRNLMALWPIARVYEWETGMMLRNGKVNRMLTPGLHWRWWFIEECYRAFNTETNVDLNAASIVTTDGVSIVVSANVSYRVTNVATLWRKIMNSNDAIRNLAIGFVASYCADSEWGYLTESREEVETGLRTYLEENLHDKGIEIIRVQLTDLAPARAYRLFNDGHKVT